MKINEIYDYEIDARLTSRNTIIFFNFRDGLRQLAEQTRYLYSVKIDAFINSFYGQSLFVHSRFTLTDSPSLPPSLALLPSPVCTQVASAKRYKTASLRTPPKEHRIQTTVASWRILNMQHFA